MQGGHSGISTLPRPIIQVRADYSGGYRMTPPGPTAGPPADNINTAWAA